MTQSVTQSNDSTNVPLAAGAGNLVGSFAVDLEGAYGLAYDTSVDRLWITNSSFAGDPINDIIGDGLEYQYQPDGTQTGETIDVGPVWYGDGTYNARTGMIWQPDIAYKVTSPAQCLVEIDPVTKVVTGKQICGPWSNFPPLEGLAYDYVTDTYYVGDAFGGITQVDGAGNVLGSGSIGLQISGLAYNPTTRLLYVAVFRSPPFDIYVVDPHNGYQVLSGFRVTSGGVPILPLGGVSLEADCSGHLWIYDIFGAKVLEVESGARGWCVNDIPWLSEDPTSGTVPGSGGGSVAAGGGNTLPVTVTFDSAGLFPGLYLRSLLLTTDTPTPVAPVPVQFTVLFADVPEGSFAWNYIYGAAGAGVMPGCNPYAPAYAFCPNEVVTRRSMAAFIERAVHGALTPPPVYLGEFDDVLLGSFNADYIQGLIQDGITAGCSVRAPALLSRRAGHARPDGGLRVEGPEGRRGAASVRGSVRGRSVPEPVCGLHRRHLRRGNHRGLRRRKLLPEREHHERADGGVPREGVWASLSAVALKNQSSYRRADAGMLPALGPALPLPRVCLWWTASRFRISRDSRVSASTSRIDVPAARRAGINPGCRPKVPNRPASTGKLHARYASARERCFSHHCQTRLKRARASGFVSGFIPENRRASTVAIWFRI